MIGPLWIKAGLAAVLLGIQFIRAIPRISERGLWPQMALRALVGVALIGLGVWVALGIDAGRYHDQSHTAREIMVAGMILAMMTGMILVISIAWSAEGVFGIPFRAIAWAGLAVVVLVGSLYLGELLELRYGIYHHRLPIAMIAVALTVVTLARPWWFWDHPKARVVRDILGDQPTMALYLGVAVYMGWLAIGRRGHPSDVLTGRGGKFSGEISDCLQFAGPVPVPKLGTQIGYHPGYETGFAIWFPAMPLVGDTSRRIAYDGHWHRIDGDTMLVLLPNDENRDVIRIAVAPGPFPRHATVDLRPSSFGGSDTSQIVASAAFDSVECHVQILGPAPDR